ncbi:H-2 class II histocompatibility antigen, A-D beta chain-like [Stegostoma tigrinum]|uniref:H-2 class II histocompatibility antigen, A-D beta chain-like n=1 Tax=Stegostoma tigrinum TaxID=3053191 RepID=UPI0028708E98|nr:H-2 class II histocompatibility antigen, A-D beta chain-like [Stegostoma tigrinum]XP_059507818.1 H-2 class II histocompatibility antigen, A-D beta chain-like [Stegostoma tigrinum]XP_059507819.1 H-2 class II histocompatibility antigen, A-D beta chain-like [Stegostoma tigrinum]
MPARMIFFCLTLLEFILAAADHTCFRVTQIPKRAAANRREDITFYCTFSICQQSSKPNVIWWKQVGNERVQIEASGRQQFGFENEATAFLSLLRVDIQDSGHYHCTVNYQGIGQRSGTPSQLFVRVAPVPLKITPKFHEENSLVSLTLLCETAAFYPEDFTLAWYKNGTKTTVGINTSKVQNSEGLYEVSSSLVDPHPPSSNLKYTCEISHISLKTPAVVTHSISTFGGFQKGELVAVSFVTKCIVE